MPMFDELNAGVSVQQLQNKFAALFDASDELERAYQFMSAYALADLEGPPLNLPANAAQMILNALADFHSWYETGQGAAGFPTATLPYNFFASMRAIDGLR